jgi:hypothetical protein
VLLILGHDDSHSAYEVIRCVHVTRRANATQMWSTTRHRVAREQYAMYPGQSYCQHDVCEAVARHPLVTMRGGVDDPASTADYACSPDLDGHVLRTLLLISRFVLAIPLTSAAQPHSRIPLRCMFPTRWSVQRGGRERVWINGKVMPRCRYQPNVRDIRSKEHSRRQTNITCYIERWRTH